MNNRRLNTILARRVLIDGQCAARTAIVTFRNDGSVVAISPFVREIYATKIIGTLKLFTFSNKIVTFTELT